MKIKQALVISAEQFLKQFNEKKSIELLQQYAVDELDLSPDQAKEFATKATSGKPTEWLKSEEDNYRFYTWYYINYVTVQKQADHEQSSENRN